jgi:hypothetical protein
MPGVGRLPLERPVDPPRLAPGRGRGDAPGQHHVALSRLVTWPRPFGAADADSPEPPVRGIRLHRNVVRDTPGVAGVPRAAEQPDGLPMTATYRVYRATEIAAARDQPECMGDSSPSRTSHFSKAAESCPSLRGKPVGLVRSGTRYRWSC